MELRVAQNDDLGAIASIDGTCFGDGADIRMRLLEHKMNLFPKGTAIVTCDASLIGFACAEVCSDLRIFNAENAEVCLYLARLAVHPSHRSRGAGRLLLDYEFAFAKNMGCAAMTLITDSAQKYYSRFGFKTTGSLHGTYIMSKKL